MKQNAYKTWLYATFAVAALSLSACADPSSATTQDDVDAAADPQTEIEQEAMGVDDAELVTDNVNSTEVSGETLVANEEVVMDDGEVDVANIDDSEMLDGTESEEHVSTY